MRGLLILLCLMAGSSPLLCQDITELERRHGFKDIRLESPADSVKGIKLKREFKEKNEFPAKLYTVTHPDYEKIGELKVKSVELKSYKGLIYEITVAVEKDPRLMKALEGQFGKAEYDIKNETYFWKGPTMTLKFRSEGKNSLELQYISFSVFNKMKEDKQQKVEDIANDF